MDMTSLCSVLFYDSDSDKNCSNMAQKGILSNSINNNLSMNWMLSNSDIPVLIVQNYVENCQDNNSFQELVNF